MSTTALIYLVAGLLLFCLGLLVCLLQKAQIRQILSLNICSASLFLVMVVLAYLPLESSSLAVPDALMHALVLTGIVVALSATALGLAILRQRRQAERDT